MFYRLPNRPLGYRLPTYRPSGVVSVAAALQRLADLRDGICLRILWRRAKGVGIFGADGCAGLVLRLQELSFSKLQTVRPKQSFLGCSFAARQPGHF